MARKLIDDYKAAIERRLRTALKIPEIQEKVLRKIEELLDELEPGKRGARTIKDLAMAFKILGDEAKMLWGEATARVEVVTRPGVGKIKMSTKERLALLQQAAKEGWLSLPREMPALPEEDEEDDLGLEEAGGDLPDASEE